MKYAIILSGGVGSRFGSDMPKQYISVKDKPIILYTIEKFCAVEEIDEIVIVAAEQWHDQILRWLQPRAENKIFKFAVAGSSRQGSILNGLKVCAESGIGNDDTVLIHDAVRPLVSVKLIKECLDALKTGEGVMPVLPVVDTIYVSGNGREVTDLLNRDTLFAGQAPEGYNLKKYYELNVNCSSELAYMGNMKVKLVEGEIGNFKITTPSDLTKFERFLEQE